MTWCNLSSVESKKHSIEVIPSKIPLLFIFHVLYVSLMAVIATPTTLIYFLTFYLILILFWQYVSVFSVMHNLAKQACLLTQRWYPSLFEQQFLLSTQGCIEFLALKKDNNVAITMTILPSSLIYWWGCHIELEEIQTKRKVTWFVFKDSVTKQDYARLARLVKVQQLD